MTEQQREDRGRGGEDRATEREEKGEEEQKERSGARVSRLHCLSVCSADRLPPTLEMLPRHVAQRVASAIAIVE